MRRAHMLAWTVPLLFAAVVVAQDGRGLPPRPLAPGAAVTFSDTIAPILHAQCVTCHRPGEAAPFPLISYEDAATRGRLIAAVTRARLMPPWQVAHGHGDFAGERRLTEDEIAAIERWVENGMPRGEPANMPPPPVFTDGWQLGQPDLVLEMPAAFTVAADGPDIFRNFVIPTGLTADRWIRGIELRPSTRPVVHHALFGHTSGGALARLSGTDGRPGFSGAMPFAAAAGQGNFGMLGGWAIGGRPAMQPDGVALQLPAGADFFLQLHLHPTGKVETERARVGLYFAEGPPTRQLESLALPAVFGFGSNIRVPAGARDYTVRDTFTLPAAITVYSVFAHAHYIGKEMRVDATLPDGSTLPLFWIPDWNFNWQDAYTYKEPIALPKGTRLDAVVRFDNSADNPRNPSSPPREVAWGMESTDEMAAIVLAYQVADDADGGSLREALAARDDAAVRRGIVAVALREAAGSGSRPLQIALLDREGRTVATLGEPGAYSQPALSPDGDRVAVIRRDPAAGRGDVWVFDVTSGRGRPLTTDPAPKSAPVWSPDGTQIAYVASRGGGFELYRRAADGTGQPELLYARGSGNPVVTEWAHGVILFWADRTTYMLPVPQGASGPLEPVALADETFNVRGGRLSPDGRLLAYSSDRSGQWETYVVPVDLSAPARTDIASAVRVSSGRALGGIVWRRDGRELYFLSMEPPQSMMAVDIATAPALQVSAPRQLFPLPGAMLGSAQLSSIGTADGERFVFPAPAADPPQAR